MTPTLLILDAHERRLTPEELAHLRAECERIGKLYAQLRAAIETQEKRK